jgi:RNA ligase
MNYNFPYINKIEDVLPYIKDREEILVIEKDWYTVINYAVAFEDTFAEIEGESTHNACIRKECRGLVFETSTGLLISRPYHKFFNVGEKPETQLNKINLYEPHVVLEKLDGSMIRAIPSKDGFRLGTRAGVTDVSENAEAFIADKSNYDRFIRKCILMNVTPIFEWCSRKNRIVIDYPEDQLILTGMRYNNTGLYVGYEAMKNYATAWNIPVVKAIAGDDTDIQKVVDHIRKWESDEGVVVRFDSGHMCKVKSADYVLRHKSKDSISQEKNVINCILQDAVDDLIPLLTPEDAERIQRFQNAFWAGLEDVACDLADLFVTGNTKYPDKKDFAVEFVQKIVLPKYAPIMYAMKAGKGSQEVLIDMIKKSLSSQSKIDAARWMFGNLKWNS